MEVLRGLLIPFAGTALGSACVFFMKREMDRTVQRATMLVLAVTIHNIPESGERKILSGVRRGV